MLVVMSIGSIAAPLTAASQAAGAAGIFFTLIDAPKPNTGGLKGPDVSAGEDIILDNVNFAYPTRPDLKILDNVSLRFPAGKITAIVGPSGSGKSTIVGLLERWYEMDGDLVTNPLVSFKPLPVFREIFLLTWCYKTLWFRNGFIHTDGKQLREIDLNWWRSQIGLVQQEPFLFNDTIFKNVENGLVGTEWEHDTEEKRKELVEQACKEAFADEFISRLPEGYDTVVGDAGIKLSGGQRQRLAIARSIIKRPKILILDEATSAIDVRGEKIVQAALDKVSKNRTTITIAHRLSTIKKADNIIVLRHGQVVQQGTHEELLEDPEGAYWGLANAQQLSMEEDDSEKSDSIEKRSIEMMIRDEETPVEEEATKKAPEAEEKAYGFLRIFGSMFYEQRHYWPWYVIMFLAAAGAAGK